MHAVQGAMAIRRARQKRAQRRQSDKRRQQKGDDGSRRPSCMSRDVESATPDKPKPGTSMTSFYIGIVFMLFGFLLIFSSMVPANVVNADWSRLLGVGVTFLLIGLLMVMVNRILSAQEDEELKRYVAGRLARTGSGQVLCRNRDPSIDFTKLAPPGMSSRRSSYRDRAGSSRSINRSPSTKLNQNIAKSMERSSSVRRSIKKTSPSQSISSNTGPVLKSNISRSNSQRLSRCNQESRNSLTKSSIKEGFRGRTSSLKTGNLPTVLVRVTDDSNNSSSLMLLGPGARPESGSR